jgi:uncharacterized protein YqfA (UPF0365 family)
MSEFLTKNWLWLTFVLIATPLLTTVGLIWLRAWQLSLSVWLKGINLGIVELMLMQMRKVDTILLVNQLLVAKQNSLEVDAQTLAAHQLAGGNIRMVVAALLSAKRFSIPLTMERACAVDLVGEDPLQLIANAVHETGKIQPPSGGADYSTNGRAGTAGTIIDPPRMVARVRFPQGELDVVVHAHTVPKVGDAVRVTVVDGVTVVVEPTLV